MSFVKDRFHLECEGWKYLYFSDRCNDMLPDKPSLYCIIEISGDNPNSIEIVYIGKTSKISSRLKYPHPVERKMVFQSSIYIQNSDNIDSDEIEFIKRYRPRYNIRHNV